MVINRYGVKGRLRDSAALRVLAFACRRSLDPMPKDGIAGNPGRSLSTHIDSTVMGRLVDLDDLIDVGDVAALLGLAHKNSVTTYMRRYEDFPVPAIEFAEGKCRAWVREDIERWHERREEHA